MPTEKQIFEVFLIIDSDGNYTVGTTGEFAEENYENDVGGGAAPPAHPAERHRKLAGTTGRDRRPSAR